MNYEQVTVKKTLSVTTDERVCQDLDANGEAQDVVLDISKAFDKVWYAGFLHELKGYNVPGRFFI